MRILFIVNMVGRGGAEIQVCELATGLVQRGHSVGVISMRPFIDFEESLQNVGVETFTLGLEAKFGILSACVRYLQVLKRFRPDIVHSHLFASSMLARLGTLVPAVVQGGRASLVCSSHSKEEAHATRYLAYRLTTGLGDAWTSVSREGISIHESRGAVPVGYARWIPNGVQLHRYTRSDVAARRKIRARLALSDSFVWLALGSFRDDMKDYSTMLRAFANVPGTSVLLIGGSGPLLEGKRSLTAELGLTERVRFLGLRSDVEDLLQAADGYVLSSDSEAMPTVLLQAAASRLPIVATNVGEVSAIVIEGKSGFIVPVHEPQRLADALRVVQGKSALARERMGEAARAHVAEHFEFGRVLDQWESLYREVLID